MPGARRKARWYVGDSGDGPAALGWKGWWGQPGSPAAVAPATNSPTGSVPLRSPVRQAKSQLGCHRELGEEKGSVPVHPLMSPQDQPGDLEAPEPGAELGIRAEGSPPSPLTLDGGGRRVAGPQLWVGAVAVEAAAAHVVTGEDADALVDLARPPAFVAGHVRVPGQHLHHVARPQAQLVLAARLVLEHGRPQRPRAAALVLARLRLDRGPGPGRRAARCPGLHGAVAP